MIKGIYLEAGLFDDYFATPRGWRRAARFRLSLFGEAAVRLVIHDATLHGGWLRRDTTFREEVDVRSGRQQAGIGLKAYYGGFSLKGGIRVDSPEFAGGKNHRWGYISVGFIL